MNLLISEKNPSYWRSLRLTPVPIFYFPLDLYDTYRAMHKARREDEEIAEMSRFVAFRAYLSATLTICHINLIKAPIRCLSGRGMTVEEWVVNEIKDLEDLTEEELEAMKAEYMSKI